ncbi:MAG TPA: aminotransferase class III-fold pyridoxal phosphate-dependent enzyme, partial [Bacteroidales bacterium]|nr:aminotransferase class III-fold pyridoxal phosphate-dependent enzyme [Bacteroidales bacterium]
FRSSGTEAVEGALNYVKTCEEEFFIVTIDNAYHGLTLGSKQLMKNANGIANIFVKTPLENEQIEKSLSRIEKLLLKKPVFFIFETILGGTLYKLPAPFLYGLNYLKEKYSDSFYLICDDMLASIRCGNWYSYPDYLNVDIIICGKSWSSGFPFSFFAISKRIRDKAGDILGTTTYGGNPMSCQAACQTIKKIQSLNLLEKIKGQNKKINEYIQLWQQYNAVSRASSYGLLFGIEMKNEKVSKQLALKLLQHGILVTRINKLLRFAPPLNIKMEELHWALNKINEIL